MIIPVKTLTGEYNITLKRGALNNLNESLMLERKVLIVTDDGVPSGYSATVANQCKTPYIITLKQGEASKSFENYKFLLSKMVEFKFSRTDAVVAVGGGVIGDLAGFVASSFMRGVDFYNIPTTVLSQVDSSIGGKVAIDFEGYKNIVGAFYPPKAVIIDPDTLKTLSERQISNGLAEALKMAVTCNTELFGIFENYDILINIDRIIEESLKIKKYVVEEDEKESGLRKILNFGHTVAHAIESENNFCNLYHGECVALGMLYMVSDNVRNRLIPIYKKLNLPTTINFDVDKMIDIIRLDKKTAGDKITVINSKNIGTYEMRNIDFSTLSAELKEVKLG